MRKNIGLIVSCLFFFFWFACLTSQSLMDLADFLMFVAGASILVIAAKKTGNWKLLWPKTTEMGWVWLAWILVIAIGLFTNNPVNKNTLEAFGEFRWILSFQILCLSVSLIDWNEKRLRWLLGITLFMTAVSFVLFPFSTDFRAGGPFYHSMPFAHTYGPAFVFLAGTLLIGWKHQSSWKWLALIATTATGIISAMSMTRGIWLGMLGGAAVISIIYSRRLGVLLTISLCAVFSLIIAFSSDMRERAFANTTEMVNSDNERMALLKGNFEIVKDYPLFGTGYSQNKNFLGPYYKKLGYPENQFISHAHNQYLHFWAGTGTLGLLCYLWFLYTTLKATIIAFRRLPITEVTLRALVLGSLGGQICFIIGSLTESNFSIAKNRFMYLVISAIGVSIYYRYIKKENFKAYQIDASN